MKQGIHPDYHTITIQMTDGTKYQTRSTYGKEGDTIQLDVDPKTHPAWVGGVHMKKTGRLERFNERFGGIASVSKSPDGSAAAPKEAKKDAAPAAAKSDKKAAPAAAPKAEKKAAAAPKADKKDAKPE